LSRDSQRARGATKNRLAFGEITDKSLVSYYFFTDSIDSVVEVSK